MVGHEAFTHTVGDKLNLRSIKFVLVTKMVQKDIGCGRESGCVKFIVDRDINFNEHVFPCK